MVDNRSRGQPNEPFSDERRGTASDARPGRPAPLATNELSTREAAAALGRNVRSIRRAIERGELAAVKHEGAYRIAVDDLAHYAAGGLRAPPAPPAHLTALPTIHRVPPLPEPLSSFVGRKAEVADALALLTTPAVRLLTLTGPGGIGKTRLSQAVAAAARDHFPEGVAFIPLAAVSRPELVIPTICHLLGLRETAKQDRRTRLLTFLATRQMLLVIDNFEHLLDAAPELTRILAHAPGVTLLATSRAPLRVAGERELPVAPLSLPAAAPAAIDLLAADATRLFIERASARDPAFVVDADSAPFVVDICARLEGLPLAIELAAAQVKTLPPRILRDRLVRRLPLLTGGARDAPHRHRTMRDAIAWSYDRLSPEEQRLCRLLAVFAGGATLEAAEAVGGAGGERGASPATFALMTSLVDQSLLVREAGAGSGGEPRFRMLETIREYGLERLAADEAEEARAAHADYFLRFARTLRPFTVMLARQAPMDQMAAEDANLHAALDWFHERRQDANFVGLVVGCWVYWYAIGRLREAEWWLDRATAKREAASLPDRARLVIAAAELLMLRGETAEAEALFAQGIPLLREAGDPFDLAAALISRGASLKFGGEYEGAEIHLAEALTVAQAIDVPELREAVAGRALGNLGVVARAQGDFDLALTRIEASLQRYQDLGLDLAEAHALVDLGAIAREQGQLRLAVERYIAALERVGEESEARLFADALTEFADVAAAWGQGRTAVLLFSAADALRERVGFTMVLPSDVATAERHLAMLRATLGEEAFTTIWAEGRTLPLHEVVVMATTMAPQSGTLPAEPGQSTAALTRREQDVLRLLAQGLTDREIAEALFISPRTVSWHVGTILGKLEASTRQEAVTRARALGLH